MKNLLYTPLLSLLFIANISFSQSSTLKDLDEVRQLSKKTSEFISQNDLDDAASGIRNFWPMPAHEFEDFKLQAIKSFKSISKGLGEAYGYTKINEELLGEIVFKEVYFIEYPSSPLRLVYIYYKSQKGWIVSSIKWDVNFEEEFE